MKKRLLKISPALSGMLYKYNHAANVTCDDCGRVMVPGEALHLVRAQTWVCEGCKNG